MRATDDFRPQSGLRRVLDALQAAAGELGAASEWSAFAASLQDRHRDATPERADTNGGNIIYLSDARRRLHHNDGPSDPRPGAAAARPFKPSFLQAVAIPDAAVPLRHAMAGVR
jgi:hypothetical protein